ncbi:MAG: hypothetical protein JEZ11_22265 [Desulfobacterales bacterium]|nr:hypothetical protein [Desulfobacterales bacterium]
MSPRLPPLIRLFMLILAVAVAMLWQCVPEAEAQAGPAGQGEWQRLPTRRTVIHYRSFQDLIRFNEKISYFPGDLAIKSLTAPKDAKGIQGVLKQKVDALFDRAQEILDMRKRIPRVNIYVYSSTDSLRAAYRELFGGECQLRAWYLFETKTVYLDATDTHEGIVAHEMGHHIIDHFFKARPPSATAEILARYIDANLLKQ